MTEERITKLLKIGLILSVILLVGLSIGTAVMWQNLNQKIDFLQEKAEKYDEYVDKNPDQIVEQYKNKVEELKKLLTGEEQKVKELLEDNNKLKSENKKLKEDLSKPIENVAKGKNLSEKIAVVTFFDFNSSVITDETKKKVKAVADFLINHNAVLIIEGHSDKIGGDSAYNLWLSNRRAEKIKDLILEFSGGKKPCDIIITGVGPKKATSSDDKDNRKVTITAIEDCEVK